MVLASRQATWIDYEEDWKVGLIGKIRSFILETSFCLRDLKIKFITKRQLCPPMDKAMLNIERVGGMKAF